MLIVLDKSSCDSRLPVPPPRPMMSPRKRMRLSSPTFDDQVGDLTKDDIDAFDSLDAQLSQPREERPDHDAWFSPDPSVGFNPATTAMPGFQRPSVTGENSKPLFIPSAAALCAAEEKMRKWQEDLDQIPTHSAPGSPRSTQVASPPRPTFSSARNAFSSIHPPETPTPAPLFRSANTETTPPRPHNSLQSSTRQPKPFKSPLIGATPSLPSHRQLFTPNVGSPLPQSTTALSPLRPSSVANHVTSQKPLGFTPLHRTAMARPKFVTPFKTVAKSGISRPSALENIQLPATPSDLRPPVSRIYPPSVPFLPRPSTQNSDRRVFDLSEHKLQIAHPCSLTCLSSSFLQTNARHFWLPATNLQR